MMKEKPAKALRHFKDDPVLKIDASSYSCLDLCERILVRGKPSFIQLTIFRNKDIFMEQTYKNNCDVFNIYDKYLSYKCNDHLIFLFSPPPSIKKCPPIL